MKKGTGVIRKIDELGRIVVPIEIRRAFDMNNQDSIEIHTVPEGILVKKHMSSCIFCGNENDLKIFKDKKVCPECAQELSANS